MQDARIVKGAYFAARGVLEERSRENGCNRGENHEGESECLMSDRS